MTTYVQWSFAGAALCYIVTFALLRTPFRRVTCVIFLLGLAANGVSVISRYAASWPMLPLYQSPFFLPLILGILCVRPLLQQKPGNAVRLLPLLLTVLLALFFPKDYYLSFIHSNTLFAHFFFLFGILGRASLFMASAEATLILWQRFRPDGAYPTTGSSAAGEVVRWVVWGFGFLTFSMFSGETWAYLGWGSPLVWDDPAVMSTLSIWCLYACFLHLHLSRFWTLPKRLVVVVAGAVLTFVFTAVAEMGVFQWPIWR